MLKNTDFIDATSPRSCTTGGAVVYATFILGSILVGSSPVVHFEAMIGPGIGLSLLSVVVATGFGIRIRKKDFLQFPAEGLRLIHFATGYLSLASIHMLLVVIWAGILFDAQGGYLFGGMLLSICALSLRSLYYCEQELYVEARK